MCILSMAHLPCIIIIPLPHFFMAIWSIFFIMAASAPPANAERTRSAASVVLIIIISFLRLLNLTTVRLAWFNKSVWSTLGRSRSQDNDRCVFDFEKYQCFPELISISGMITHFPRSNMYPGWHRTLVTCFFMLILLFVALSATPANAINSKIPTKTLIIICASTQFQPTPK